jgi:hypothetical protein
MISAVRRTITARPAGRTMSLGDIRKFLGSIESLPDEAPVKAKVGFGKVLRSLTVEDEEVGLSEYLRAIAPDDDTDDRKKDKAARGASD